MPAFEIEMKTTSPTDGISDVSCSLERLIALMESNNADFQEAAIDRDTGDKWLTDNLYSRWMIYLIATEKLQEVRQMVNATEDALLKNGHVPVSLAGSVELQAAPVDTTEWDGALAAYHAAQRDHDAVADDDPSKAALVEAATVALHTLIATPPPNNEAFAEKLRIIDSEGYQEGPNVWESIIADARRLGPTGD